jgi:hypothetical protein
LPAATAISSNQNTRMRTQWSRTRFERKLHRITKPTVVIASSYRTEDPWFESRQGVRFLGIYTMQCCCHYLICIVIVPMYFIKKCFKFKEKRN